MLEYVCRGRTLHAVDASSECQWLEDDSCVRKKLDVVVLLEIALRNLIVVRVLGLVRHILQLFEKR